MHSFIPLTFNDVVKNYCILYSEKMPSSMGRIMGLCEYYWPIFDEIFSHYGLPLELKALVIVESMLNPTATSRVGAKGLWQFMYGTAKGYGMVIDSWMDERMDPLKSTEAAARYIADSYRIFDDWELALASYNCGVNGVNKAIRRSGGKRGFWEIYPYLPRETRGYVPAFEGALYTLHYYKEYGIKPRADLVNAIPVDTFVVHRNIHYGQLNDVIGVPVETVAALNPQYLHNIVPGQVRDCVLRLPMKYTNAFLERQDSIFVHDTAKYFNAVEMKKIRDGVAFSGNGIVYKVKSGDILGRIAARYGVTVAQIKKWNNLKSTNLRIGQRLLLYPGKK